MRAVFAFPFLLLLLLIFLVFFFFWAGAAVPFIINDMKIILLERPKVNYEGKVQEGTGRSWMLETINDGGNDDH